MAALLVNMGNIHLDGVNFGKSETLKLPEAIRAYDALDAKDTGAYTSKYKKIIRELQISAKNGTVCIMVAPKDLAAATYNVSNISEQLDGKVLVSGYLNYGKPFYLEDSQLYTDDLLLEKHTFSKTDTQGYEVCLTVLVVANTTTDHLQGMYHDHYEEKLHSVHRSIELLTYPICFRNNRGFSHYKKGDKVCLSVGSPHRMANESRANLAADYVKHLYKAVVHTVHDDRIIVSLYEKTSEDIITTTTCQHHRFIVPQEEVIFHMI